MKTSFEFLIDLSFNNDRNWLKENDKIYREAKGEFENLVENILPRVKVLDSTIDAESAKDCIFRINRDVRFSKNKQPYKTNFGAYFAKGKKKGLHAGYYLHLEPDNSFIGGGFYAPDSSSLLKIRTHISHNLDRFETIVNNKDFKNVFGDLKGDKLVRPPKGFSIETPGLDYIKHKNFIVMHKLENDFWFEENLSDRIYEVYKVLKDFNDFINEGLKK